MTQEEQYKSFIKYCTKAGKSISNYSDFKRINETIAKIKGVENMISTLAYIQKSCKI